MAGQIFFQNSNFSCQNSKFVFSSFSKIPWATPGILASIIYRVSQKTWEFSDEFDIILVIN